MSEGDSEYLRTIRVTNVPDQITENKLMIYFQRKKNGGGEVKEIQMFPDVHEARLVFEDVAGKIYHVHFLYSSTSAYIATQFSSLSFRRVKGETKSA